MKKQKLITLKRFFLFYRYFPTIVCILGSVVCIALRLSSILTGREDLKRASLIALVVFSACSLLYDYFFGIAALVIAGEMIFFRVEKMPI